MSANATESHQSRVDERLRRQIEHDATLSTIRDVHVLTELRDDGISYITAGDIKVNGQRCHVSVIPIGRDGRKDGGNLVPGPWGWVNRSATVISAHPIPEKPCPTVKVGDLLVIDKVVYRLIVNPRSRFARDSDHYGLEVVDSGVGE
jgi:hypothetical protein